jgi:hypothetical protein
MSIILRISMPANDIQIAIATRKYSYTLLTITIIFIATHCAMNYYNHEVEEVNWLVFQLFDLDEENNLPTWFSSFLLLNSSLVMYLVARINRDRGYFHWMLLSVGFLVLSIDEVAGIHESIHTAIDFNWAYAGGILVLALGLSFIPFLLSLNRRLAILFVISGLIYVTGIIGVELLSEDMDEDSMAYGFATAVEEGLEMLGALLFLAVNLEELKRQNDTTLTISAR